MFKCYLKKKLHKEVFTYFNNNNHYKLVKKKKYIYIYTYFYML